MRGVSPQNSTDTIVYQLSYSENKRKVMVLPHAVYKKKNPVVLKMQTFKKYKILEKNI